MKKRKIGRKVSTVAVLAASCMLQSCFLVSGGTVWAQEETGQESLQEGQSLLELTAQEVETEEGSAASARLKIGDWLDYGDYGIERTDVPGTDYFFYVTTADEQGNLIDDQQLAYCVQSYFLTPLPGDHSDDMTDQVSAIGGEKNLQKVIYYGYGGPGYDADEFVQLLVDMDEEYYENVYLALSEEEQSELAYVLTHGAASYAYFNDGTPMEEYLKLQFEIKYGENWEKEMGYFLEQEMELSGIEDDDLNLLGASYGMNQRGIALTKGWYQLLTAKEEPQLSVTSEDGVYSFHGNEKNEELSLSFQVPEGLECTVSRKDGSTELAAEGTKVTLSPAESVSFVCTEDIFSEEKDGITQMEVPVEGALTGTEQEAWNLVILEMNKGTRESVSKRQQDIAAVSLIDAGKTELDFQVELEKKSASVKVTDEKGQSIPGAELGIYYDSNANDRAMTVTTDDDGEAYLEFILNEKLLDNEGNLYVREESVPAGYILDDTVYCIQADGTAEITNSSKKTSFDGQVIWHDSEDADQLRPDGITVTLSLDGSVIDSQEISGENDWKYSFDELDQYGQNGTRENEYTIEAEAPEGYTVEMDGDLIICTHPASVYPEIEVMAELAGRDIKEGEFTFELTQITDETGAQEAEDGIHSTASNDAEGKTVFDDIQITEPGTYYFQIEKALEDGEESADGSAPESFIAKAEVTAGGEFGDQLEAEVTYPKGQPEFSFTYTASGEAVIGDIQIALENGTLSADMFQFQLKDAEGNVLQTASNDQDGKVTFDPLTYTEEQIGQKLEYTISQVDEGAENITYDAAVYTVSVTVEDSETSNGTLQITVEADSMTFVNVMAEPETETESETEPPTEAPTETQAVSESEILSEITTETETEILTEAQTEKVTEKMEDTAAASESETEAEEKESGSVLPWIAVIIILVIIVLLFVYKNKKKK